MRFVLLLVGVAFSAHSGCPAQFSPPFELHVTTQTPDVRGIYVSSYGLPTRKADSVAVIDALNVPGVDGMLLVISWKVLEPGMGKFNWPLLDRWMNIAAGAGKKIELSIPGELTPNWLFQPAPVGAGISPLYFTFTRRPTDTTCLSDTLARPWDTTFLAQWDLMLDSVSAHLKAVNTYDAVVLLRLTGINKDSDELHLPEQGSPKAPCAQNCVATWLAAGYKPSRLLQGWDGITTSFKKHFPDKTFSVAIIASANPFPPIAEDSTVYKNDSIPNQNLPLLILASQKLPGQLVIQNNTLYPGEPAQSETVQSAESLKTMIAFQTNEDIKARGAGCGQRGSTNDTTACTDSTYMSELNMGIYPKGPGNSLRAKYIEVFALNVNATPGDILTAHNELFAPGPTSVRLVDPGIPSGFELRQNYPNPFNPSTLITFELSTRVFVSLKVYDVLGRLIATLANETKPPGTYAVRFDASGLSSGEYVYRLKAGSCDKSRSMLVIK
jgi:hypothetical protein